MVDTIDGIVSGRKVRIFCNINLPDIYNAGHFGAISKFIFRKQNVDFVFLPFHCQSQFVLFFDVHFTLKKLFF